MARQIALLRGVNLGPVNRVPMPALRELLTQAGYEDVRTLVASGNIVLTTRRKPETVARDIQKRIKDAMGVDTPVVMRTRAELAEVLARDPLGDLVTEPRRYQVTFLDVEPPDATVKQLEALDTGDERFVVVGREIYTWHPNGIQNSALAKLLAGRTLGVTATARNWNTVTKLLKLADD
jgi:uncharacterized protein (DUF1697 family)